MLYSVEKKYKDQTNLVFNVPKRGHKGLPNYNFEFVIPKVYKCLAFLAQNNMVLYYIILILFAVGNSYCKL